MITEAPASREQELLAALHRVSLFTQLHEEDADCQGLAKN